MRAASFAASFTGNFASGGVGTVTVGFTCGCGDNDADDDADDDTDGDADTAVDGDDADTDANGKGVDTAVTDGSDTAFAAATGAAASFDTVNLFDFPLLVLHVTPFDAISLYYLPPNETRTGFL